MIIHDKITIISVQNSKKERKKENKGVQKIESENKRIQLTHLTYFSNMPSPISKHLVG